MKRASTFIYCAITILAALMMQGCASQSRTAVKEEQKDSRTELARAAFALFEKENTYSAALYLAKQPDSLLATQVFGDLMSHLYWKKANLPAALAIGRAGIQFGLDAAEREQGSDPKRAGEIRGAVKALAYDVASFTWPGWGDLPGEMHIGASELAWGMEAAKLNLKLADELRKNETALARGSWMLGAHYLAIAEYDEALFRFQVSVDHYTKVKEQGGELLLAQGFIHVTALLKNPGDKKVRISLDRIETRLKGIKEGALFINQLETALALLSKL
jgi:hypothetical protein